jgi:hypothetical protein
MYGLLSVAGGEVCGNQEAIGKRMAGTGACTAGFRRLLVFSGFHAITRYMWSQGLTISGDTL